jgi:ADP-heptose:LPS heptosyltransferase
LIGSFSINKTGLSFKDKTVQSIIVWHYSILNFILGVFQKILFRNNDILSAKRILIFRTGSMGDSICALPAINSIHKNFPEAEIDILTNAGAENLVSLGALIDRSLVNEVIDYFGLEKKELAEKLKQKHYDLFIQLPQDQATITRQIRDMFIAKFLGIKNAFGWEIASTRFLAKWQARLITFVNERDRLLNILEQNGLKNYGMEFPLGITEEIRSVVERLIEDKRLKEKDKIVGMVVGAKREQNRWPIEYYKEVAHYLINDGYNILLFGGQEDLSLAYQIEAKNVYNFCGKLKPLESAELMKHCKLIISNDSGPMHLAYAVDTPVITIFSSRDYANKWFPPENNITLRNNKELCIECFDTCKKQNECIKNITAERAIGLLKSLLLN